MKYLTRIVLLLVLGFFAGNIQAQNTDTAFTLNVQGLDKKFVKKYVKKFNKLNRLELPNFELEDMDGNRVNLQNFKGTVIYIDFWATSCAACIEEIPYLRKLQERNSKEDYLFLNICIDSSKEGWKRIVKSKDFPGINLYTSSDFLQKYFKIKAVPKYMVIDAKGYVKGNDVSAPSEALLADFILYKVSQGETAKEAVKRLWSNNLSTEDTKKMLFIMQELNDQQTE